jgi:hypothetical protein
MVMAVKALRIIIYVFCKAVLSAAQRFRGGYAAGSWGSYELVICQMIAKLLVLSGIALWCQTTILLGETLFHIDCIFNGPL